MQLESSLLQQCWFLAGPTASGKSAVALELARRLDAEIVGLDSMTLYRGLDIGTAKPDAQARSRIPHHLFDVLEPEADYSVGQYVEAARDVCHDIVSRGRVPLFVGGAGLYLRSVLRGVSPTPPADWGVRRRWEQMANAGHDLHAELQRVDPVSAARLHPHDQRRLVRALEVHTLTGRPLADWQTQNALPLELRPRHVVWLSLPRPVLRARIDERVDRMLEAGWLDEARRLHARQPPVSRTAAQALGYQELFAHLRGEYSLSQAVDLIRQHTHQFAKRQCTWFRNLVECHPVPLEGTESPEQVADVLVGAAE